MLQSFRLPKGLDYIKLPCLNRSESGELSSKYLDLDIEMTLRLRSDIILAAVRNYQPDLFLVDKKPYGLRNELATAIRYIKCTRPQTKFVLLLRDILDSPEKTIQEWKDHNYFSALDLLYDRILVVGMPEVFDLRKEYEFPVDVANKVEFCGYLRKKPGQISRSTLRQQLGIPTDKKLVLVTPGGGEDGYHLVQQYLQGLALRSETEKFHSIIITGSEMNEILRSQLKQQVHQFPNTQIIEFTNDLMSYIDAADLVVCMGGYNTVTEVLSQGKRSISIPRIKPGYEQLLRTDRLHKLDFLHQIHPEQLTPDNLFQAVTHQLEESPAFSVNRLDLQGLPKVNQAISKLLFQHSGCESQSTVKPSPRKPIMAEV